MKFYYLLPFLMLVSLQACAPHRSVEETLPGPLPKSFKEWNKGPVEPAIDLSWWESFGDAELTSLIKEALSKNLDIAQAAARLKQAEAIVRRENAGRFPYLNAQYERSRESQPGFFGTNSGTSYSASIAAGYELDLWKKLANRTSAARLEKEASREELHTAYITVSCEVADLYYQVIEARQQLAVIDKIINSLKEALELVERRYAQGLVSSLDVYQARQNLEEARARRPQFEASAARAKHALSVLLGRYPESPPETEIVQIPFIHEVFPSGLSSRLLLERPDVKAAYLRLRASDSRIAAAIAERFPSLNLLGRYGRSSSAFSTGAIVGNFWSITLDAVLPIIDAGKRRAEVNRARAVAEEDLARYKQAVLKAFQEVEDALAANRTDEDRLQKLKANSEICLHALNLAMNRYMKGLSDYLPVLTARTRSLDAESTLIAARRQLISDRITLIRALGGDWAKPGNPSHMHNYKRQEVISR